MNQDQIQINKLEEENQLLQHANQDYLQKIMNEVKEIKTKQRDELTKNKADVQLKIS